MDYEYPVYLEAEGDEYFLRFPDFPEIISDWSPEEVSANDMKRHAHDALVAALQTRINFGDVIPRPSKPESGAVVIYLSPLIAAKISLYELLVITSDEPRDFAALLDVRPTDLKRLLDLSHESKSEPIMAAFEKLGLRLTYRTEKLKEQSFAGS